jgi:hypothetical protein
MFDARPGNKRWPAMVQWLQQHQRTMELIRQGSEKPVLGFALGSEGSAKDPELWPTLTASNGPALEKDWLISVLSPHLNQTRQLAQVLDADIAWAREQKDGARITADLAAIARLGSQVRRNDDFLITALVAIAIQSISIDQMDRTLLKSPELISDSDLQSLSHLLSSPSQTEQLLTLRGERFFFYDTLQRTYTDDGHGDGRITRQGIQMFMSVSRHPPEPGAFAAGPVIASRHDMQDQYDYFMNKAEVNFSKSYRDADWSGWDQEFIEWRQSPIRMVRYAPIAIFLPSLSRAHFTAQRYLTERDGVVAGMAMEAYRRKTGGYPDRLEALVPAYLPSVPIDPVTGQAIHYQLNDGRPLIYSVGADGDDDSGRMPLDKRGKPSNRLAAEMLANPATAPDGDWIIYPKPRPAAEPDDEESQP